MRFFLVILFFLFIGTNGIPCPNGYTDGGDGSCYSGNTWSPRTRDNGYRECVRDNAYIMDVANAFQNTAFMNSFGSVEFAWLGLTCLNNSAASCLWDNGIAMASSSYSNFNGGSPFVQDGACVVMAVKTGKWYSADCSNYHAYFGCKYTPNIDIPYCEYDDTVFQGKCYHTTDVTTSEDATAICTNYNSLQVSIHSDGENAFVRGLTVAYTYGNQNRKQLFLGIQQNNTWTDGTAVDYDNYGYKNNALGSCVSMSLYDDLVPAGMWISSQCTGSLPLTVCKKDPFEPTPLPTLAPPQCNATQFYTGYGTVYSPGYPLGSQPNHCEFLITEEEGMVVHITLRDLQLDRNSVLQLYGGLFDTRPFVNLTNVSIYSQLYESPSNMLKIVYDTAGSENSNNLWSGDYRPVNLNTEPPTTVDYNCGPNYYYDSGSISSPNYPGSYPQVTRNCSYVLHPYSSRVCFTFDAFDIRYYDYVYLYDGDPSIGLLMATFTGWSQGGDGVYCTSHYNEMWVVFSTFDSYNAGQVTGWKGRFADDSSQLISTSPSY